MKKIPISAPNIMTTIMVLFLTTTTIPLPPSLRLFPLPPCDALHPLESTPTCGLHHFRTTPWFYIRRQYLAQHLLPPLLQTPIFPIPALLLSRARTLTADMVYLYLSFSPVPLLTKLYYAHVPIPHFTHANADHPHIRHTPYYLSTFTISSLHVQASPR